MNVLSLITHYRHVPRWEENTSRIDFIDKRWAKRGLFSKALQLTRLAPNYDCIVFFYDIMLPIVFSLITADSRRSHPSYVMVFTTLLCDVVKFGEAGHSIKLAAAISKVALASLPKVGSHHGYLRSSFARRGRLLFERTGHAS